MTLTLALYAGAKEGSKPEYTKEAAALGFLLANHRCLVRYGGSSRGIMGAFAASFLAEAKKNNAGAELFGVIPRKYHYGNRPEELGFDFTITNTLAERKHLLVDGTDGFIVLPGGTGTLDELFEAVEIDNTVESKAGDTSGVRPVFLMNTAGYYDHLISQLEHGQKEGLIGPAGVDFLKTSRDASGIYALLRSRFSF